jgi:N-acetyl-beta-hexosaminidase
MKADDITLQWVEAQTTDGSTETRLHLQNSGSTSLPRTGWRIWFSLGLDFAADETRVRRSLVDGRYGYFEPTTSFPDLAPGDAIELDVANWLFTGMALAAHQGFHVTTVGLHNGNNEEQLLGSPREARPVLAAGENVPNSSIARSSPSADTTLQTAERLFERHDVLTRPPTEFGIDGPAEATTHESAIHLVPQPKRLEVTSGDPLDVTRGVSIVNDTGLALPDAWFDGITCADDGAQVRMTLTPASTERYQLTTHEKGIDIAGDEVGLRHALTSLRQLINATAGLLPPTLIEDVPDWSHRAVFLDIARHYRDLATIRRTIRGMAAYKLNRLQLGISNDEGWRLEIPGLPALTAIGSRRAHEAHDAHGRRRALYPAWGDNHEETGGILSRHDFVALLRFATDHGVEIILEFNLPGHANALLRALEDGPLQLVDPNDISHYRSAQGYTRNVVNVAMPDTWRFFEQVIRELAAMYDDAGVPFRTLHLGGDETPDGAWFGSPLVRAAPFWNPDWNVEDPEDAKAARRALMTHHHAQVTRIASEIAPQLTLGFWHEMAPYAGAAPRQYFNAWPTEADPDGTTRAIIDAGQQVVISNASFLYFDMPYGRAADEPGLPWASYIDEPLIHAYDPVHSLDLDDVARQHVAGLQAQLWGETVYSRELADFYLFPRLLALAERCWNAVPQPGSWRAFATTLGLRELAHVERLGIAWRVPPPGARVQEGKLHTNTLYPGLDVHYTLDGTAPNQHSPRWDGPVTVPDHATIRLTAVGPGGRCSRVVAVSTDVAP